MRCFVITMLTLVGLGIAMGCKRIFILPSLVEPSAIRSATRNNTVSEAFPSPASTDDSGAVLPKIAWLMTYPNSVRESMVIPI